jgi:hypothetical protein
MPLSTLSHAALHRLTVREIDRQLLAHELARIDAATHVAATGQAIYCYGTERDCVDFATGLRGVTVRPILDRDRADLARHKRQAWART